MGKRSILGFLGAVVFTYAAVDSFDYARDVAVANNFWNSSDHHEASARLLEMRPEYVEHLRDVENPRLTTLGYGLGALASLCIAGLFVSDIVRDSRGSLEKEER